uniref:Uncharacterized protein n=1 Tax=viral metagenome TaxID=1070528 RepID=A0A6M3KWC8_9ZZZZ
MFSSDMKYMIAEKIQKILQETCHPELPKEEIQFLLHVNGAEGWSWANITNNNPKIKISIPICLQRNTNVK